MLARQFMNMKIPEDIDPIAKMIEDEVRFRHDLAQFCNLSLPNLQSKNIVSLIAYAAGETVNMYAIFAALIKYLPDELAKILMIELVTEMEKLVNSTFGQTLEEMQGLVEQREYYVSVIDNILARHFQLIEYLKSLSPTIQEDAV